LYGSKKEGREEGQEGCEEEGDEKAPLIASQKQPLSGAVFIYVTHGNLMIHNVSPL